MWTARTGLRLAAITVALAVVGCGGGERAELGKIEQRETWSPASGSIDYDNCLIEDVYVIYDEHELGCRGYAITYYRVLPSGVCDWSDEVGFDLWEDHNSYERW